MKAAALPLLAGSLRRTSFLWNPSDPHMTLTAPIGIDVESLQSNPSVQDLLSALDAPTRDAVLGILASLDAEVLEALLEALETLDACYAGIDVLVALLKGKQGEIELDDRCRDALKSLMNAAKEHLGPSSCPGAGFAEPD